MAYTKYIFPSDTLKAKTASNKAGLLKNKKRSDLVGYGIELLLSQLRYHPETYLEYGPYWWALIKILIKNGHDVGTTMDEEIAEVYRGETDEETFTAAFLFMDYYLDMFFQGNRKFQLDDSGEDWILRDPDVENLRGIDPF